MSQIPRPFHWSQEDEVAAMTMETASQPSPSTHSIGQSSLRSGGYSEDDNNFENWVHGQQEYHDASQGRRTRARARTSTPTLPNTSSLLHQDYNDSQNATKEEDKDQISSQDSQLIRLAREASARVTERERSASVRTPSPGLDSLVRNRTQSHSYAHKSQPRYKAEARTLRLSSPPDSETTHRDEKVLTTAGNEIKVKNERDTTPHSSPTFQTEVINSAMHTPFQNPLSRPTQSVLSPRPYNAIPRRYETRASSRLRSTSLSEDYSPSPQPLKKVDSSLLPSPIIKFASLQSETGTSASNVLWSEKGGGKATSPALSVDTNESKGNDTSSQISLEIETALAERYSAVQRLLQECAELEQCTQDQKKKERLDKLEQTEVGEAPVGKPIISPKKEALGPPAPNASSVSSEVDSENSDSESRNKRDLKIEVEEAHSEDETKGEITRKVISPHKKPVLRSSPSPPPADQTFEPSIPSTSLSLTPANKSNSPDDITYSEEKHVKRIESQSLEELPGKKSGNLFKPRSSSSEDHPFVKKPLAKLDTDGEIEAMLLNTGNGSLALQELIEIGGNDGCNEAAYEFQGESGSSAQAHIGEEDLVQGFRAHLLSMQVDAAEQVQQASRSLSNSPSYVEEDDDEMSDLELRKLFTSPPLALRHTQGDPDFHEDNLRSLSPHVFFKDRNDTQSGTSTQDVGDIGKKQQALSQRASPSASNIPPSPATQSNLEAAIEDGDHVPQKVVQAGVKPVMKRSSRRAPPKAVEAVHHDQPVAAASTQTAQEQLAQSQRPQLTVPNDENSSNWKKSQPEVQTEALIVHGKEPETPLYDKASHSSAAGGVPDKSTHHAQGIARQTMGNLASASYFDDASQNEQMYEMQCPRCQDCGSTAIGNLEYYGTCDITGPSLSARPAPAHLQFPHLQTTSGVSGQKHAETEPSSSSSESSFNSDSSLEEEEVEAVQMEVPNVRVRHVERLSKPVAAQLREQYTYSKPVQALPRNGSHSTSQALPTKQPAKTVRIQLPEKTKKGLPRKTVSSDHDNLRNIPEKLSNKEKKPTLSQKVELAMRARPKAATGTGSILPDLPSTRYSAKEASTQAIYNMAGLPAASKAYLAAAGIAIRPPGQAQRTAFGTGAKVLPPTYMAAAEGQMKAYTRTQPISGPSRISDTVKKPTAVFTGQLPQSGALVVRNKPTRQPTPVMESEIPTPKTAVKKPRSRQTTKAAPVEVATKSKRLIESEDSSDESDAEQFQLQQVAPPPRAKKARSTKQKDVKPPPPKKPISASKKRKAQLVTDNAIEQSQAPLAKRVKVEGNIQAPAPQQVASGAGRLTAKSMNTRQYDNTQIPLNKLPIRAPPRTASVHETVPKPYRQDHTDSDGSGRRAGNIQQINKIAAMPIPKPVNIARASVPRPELQRQIVRRGQQARALARAYEDAGEEEEEEHVLDEYFSNEADDDELEAQASASTPTNYRIARQQVGRTTQGRSTSSQSRRKTSNQIQTSVAHKVRHPVVRGESEEEGSDEDEDEDDDESTDYDRKYEEPTKRGRPRNAPQAKATVHPSIRNEDIPMKSVKQAAKPKKEGATTKQGRGRGQGRAPALHEKKDDDQHEVDMGEQVIATPAQKPRGKKTPAGPAKPRAPRGRGRGRGK